MSWRTLKGGACCLCLLLTGPAAGQTLFTEVTDQAMKSPMIAARGAAFGDFDNDGWVDLFQAEGLFTRLLDTSGHQVALLHNEGNGSFASYNELLQGAVPGSAKGAGPVFGDYDNDGDLDLFVPMGAYALPNRVRNRLLRNDGGVFTEVASAAGLTEELPTNSAIWLDYDRDGYLDLYVGNWTDQFIEDWQNLETPVLTNTLYRNRGDGTFADVTRQAGLYLQLSAGGGNEGGTAAGDFNGDGWPDLYLGIWANPNRLFFNDGQGGFREVTTREISDPGEANGVAIGDIDNDGDLDIFQTAGGGSALFFRPLLLLNLGDGQFLDVTEGVGLASLVGTQSLGASLGDVDNDGDLDLLVAFLGDNPLRKRLSLFLNQGDGIFVDESVRSGISLPSAPVAPLVDRIWGVNLADYDNDGFLDAMVGHSGGAGLRPWGRGLFRNRGNENHHLRVELVGIRSNRSGIGARLIASSGNLQQMREILGGLGRYQDEMVAHFGLGTRTQVDRLEIRWPSGQVDVLTDIPADQKIRVFEGRASYYTVVTTRWVVAPPETLVANTQARVAMAVRPALFEPDATITQVTADLSSLAGPMSALLQEADDGTWRLDDLSLSVAGRTGYHILSVLIDQTTSLGPYWVQLSRGVAVLPAADLAIFDEVLLPDWQEEHHRRVEIADLAHSGEIHTGKVAGFFQVRGGGSGGWDITFRPAAPVDPFGYTTLRFAIRPGEISLPNSARFSVNLFPGQGINLLEGARLDVTRQEWQVVEIPMGAFERVGPIEAITFLGNFAGTFYLDDLRLVAATPPAITVVEEERTAALPQAFALSQNFPNPFNGDTVIRFALPERGEVELAVYNLAGQQVVRLVEGAREGGNYAVRWDGRDERGKELASGVYLYRLRAGEKMETRKLALLR